jgi:hypothetical protein
MAWIAVVSSLVFSAGPPAWAGSGFCQAIVEERLGALGIAEADVRKIRIYAYTRGKEDRVVRREANIRLHSCKGQIAMNLSRDCYIREVYTRGECSLAGAKNY